jgi:hypothetical protein
MVGERRDVLPPELLRIGVKFADGRTATNIGGHDRPMGGPVMDALRGGGRRGGGESRFHQEYWISPLPPPGPVNFVCEWPAVEIPVARQEIDAQLILDAADTARAIFGDGHHVLKDGRDWRLGTDADVAWINDGTSAGATITSAIPRARARPSDRSASSAPPNLSFHHLPRRQETQRLSDPAGCDVMGMDVRDELTDAVVR